MGATPYAGGVTFRVWALFATGVSVAGDFNNWSTTADPLSSENNGYWSVDVPGVGVGAQYKFCITASDGTLRHLLRRATTCRSAGMSESGLTRPSSFHRISK
jgi:1,4-alpha-glucan branching enzyme